MQEEVCKVSIGSFPGQEVWITMGVPGCGKTTWANEFISNQAQPSKWVNCNRDDLRLPHCAVEGDINTYKFTRARERAVTEQQLRISHDAMTSGKSLIVSDTNLKDSALTFWKDFAEGYNLPLRTKMFDVPFEVCWQRNLKRYSTVHAGRMITMERQMRALLGKYVKVVEQEAHLRPAIIVDIDGTLAHMERSRSKPNGRGPFEWSKVGLDSVDVEVALVLSFFSELGYRIILLSGRDSVCRPETEQWLSEHEIRYDELHMRPTMPEGVQDPKDYVVKEDLYMEHVQGRYDVKFVLDDRAQVCRLWEIMGLKVWNVGGFLSEF